MMSILTDFYIWFYNNDIVENGKPASQYFDDLGNI